MKTLELADAGKLAEELKGGEEIVLRENGKAVAKVSPLQTIEERIEELVAQGKARRGTGELPAWFFEERPPKFPSSVLDELMRDRHSRNW